ncbi:hypothetical protein DFP72DRAFT_483395 [Ephemerocybe angulata]|uniref:Uncharacterized protein n=1 Tax=Ephemerocybe angulata TaxID=980116 RepID=A0A8H6MGJ1_9AGAR|nr:hypothetical protein DFP72DRAFT_483395 [Tulosesus angulatus]
MPSLRRTVSSPVPRSSPYSSTLNGVTARGSGHRRSSGSETASRRVLADIEWWRVTEGQCEPGSGDQEAEEHTSDDAQPVVARATPGGSYFEARTGVDHPLNLSLPWPTTMMPASETEQVLPTAEFAALSLAPRTPPKRCLSLDTTSAYSSLESTPEGPSPIELESGVLRLELAGMGPVFFEDKFTRPSTPPPSLGLTDLFNDIFSLQDDFHCFFESTTPSLFASSVVC